ncbi:MAG TPA: FCD domain-containing protein [Marmoricola sp.]|nr:FCD domain-containing protein [Marmoricola sp.]
MAEQSRATQGHAQRRVDGDLGEVVLGPVRGHHAFESCVEQLATAIRLGVFPLGSALPPERELADRMSVSRATLREAIAALRTAGMVNTTRGRGGGTVVSHRPEAPQPSRVGELAGRRDSLLDSLVFRRVVEPGACHVAASRARGGDAAERIRTALADVAAAGDAPAHRQADSRLHLEIAGATGSPAIVRAVTQVQSDLHDMLSAIPVLEVNIDHSNAQHEAIVDAILSGDGVRARRVMEAHCDDTAALLRGLLG